MTPLEKAARLRLDIAGVADHVRNATYGTGTWLRAEGALSIAELTLKELRKAIRQHRKRERRNK